MNRIEWSLAILISLIVTIGLGLVVFIILGDANDEIVERITYCSDHSGVVFERSEFLGGTWDKDFHFMSDLEFKQYCEEK